MNFFPLVFLGLLVLVGVQGEGESKITFHNHHDKMVTLYWDTFGSSSVANGLSRISDVSPGETITMDTHTGHVFEVIESHTFFSLDLIQVRHHDQHFHIYYKVRQCGVQDSEEEEEGEEGAFLLFPPTSSISILKDFQAFIRVALPMYKKNQWIDPTPEIARGRASFETRRVWLNAEQPKVTPLFTKVGYEITQLPKGVWEDIQTFWTENRHLMALEKWDQENHHVNHWQAPSYMLWLPRQTQEKLKKEAAKVLERWIGGNIPLEWTSLYGIRTYTNNSVLLNHVDRSATHAVSAIIQVDQRVEDDWLLEVIGHDRIVRELKLLPGQMALYESASVVHGRPKPFNGDYFSNLFIHYRPKENWDVRAL